MALGAKLVSSHYDASACGQVLHKDVLILKILRVAVCLVLLTVAQQVSADQTLLLSDTPEQIKVTSYLGLLEDAEHKYASENITDQQFNDLFAPLADGTSNYGFSDSAWWVRLKLKNDGDSDVSATLRLDYPLLDHVDVWVLSAGTVKNSWQTGNRRTFLTRAVPHRDFLFPLTLSEQEEQTVYLRVKTNGPVNIGLTLYGEQALQLTTQLEYLVLGAYFGGFLLLALCLLLLYLMDLQTAFLYYLAYIVSYAGYMLTFNGLASQYIWPHAPEIGQIGRPILLTLAILFLLQFSRSLLGIGSISKVLFRCVSALQGILVLMLLGIPLFGYGSLVMPFAAILLIALVLVLAMGVTAHRAGEAAAKYYLLAWSVFLGGLLIYLLKVFGWLPHNFVTHYGFQIGSFFEFIFLSGALVVRVRELRQQSHADGLTGLANRRCFDEQLTEEFLMSARPESELSLLVIDVDHFKLFNDTHGHTLGDKVLKELGKLFKKQIRRPGQAFRYGGEEFVVLLPRTGQKEALILAERLRQCAQSDLPYDNVTISVGAVSLQQGGFECADQFFEAGDRALYRAKNEGRNRVAMHSSTLGPAEEILEKQNLRPSLESG